MGQPTPALLVIAALSGIAGAQQTGDPPPRLVLERLKGDCPASLEWRSLRGTVVVVSFFSESVFPGDPVEWNETAQKFQGEPVLFLHVVGGSEFLLDQALKQAGFRGCVLFDSDLRTSGISNCRASKEPW